MRNRFVTCKLTLNNKVSCILYLVKSIICLEARDRNKKLRLTGGSRLQFDNDHVRVATPMRPADWPVAR